MMVIKAKGAYIEFHVDYMYANYHCCNAHKPPRLGLITGAKTVYSNKLLTTGRKRLIMRPPSLSDLEEHRQRCDSRSQGYMFYVFGQFIQ